MGKAAHRVVPGFYSLSRPHCPVWEVNDHGSVLIWAHGDT